METLGPAWTADRAGEMDLEVTADAECERREWVSVALPTIGKGEKDLSRRLPEAIAPRFINNRAESRNTGEYSNLCADSNIQKTPSLSALNTDRGLLAALG